MPSETQALYFHLGLQADDDGIVEAYNVLRTLGVGEDSLKILVAKGFVQVLNEDLVSFILDWTEHNKIRPDRKVDSIYKNLLLQINPNVSLIESRERADVLKKRVGQPMDNQWTADGQHRLGEDRIGQDRLGEVSIEIGEEQVKKKKGKTFSPPTLEEVQEYAKEKGLIVDTAYFFDYFSTGEWIDSKGNKVKNWKQKLLTWNKRELEKQSNGSYKKFTGTTKGQAEKGRDYQRYPEESLPDFLEK